jgi:hypothetical protein
LRVHFGEEWRAPTDG